ncbi:Holliday junction ATP-dependent DNA helicase RuvA [Companilactobacillus sp. RD055328]|uniref:Holliday junction branch migration protein RuvA n=1 Tax=Companilactobacillus sp. RD055328 TaxID=2916634 RepID=UPI001FC89615|nr:Holliday junction branch migration protein RuvA [Companilactobacillus sp. RD055328]GKQ42121.1 Holliday junction ATP-dependent DNA helicase RuvA [Companilactobacillus sp. RD055328]
MFEYLKGEVVALHPSYVVIDVNGVGYKLLVANPYRYEVNNQSTIYVEQIVRENEQSLYGFYDLAEKQLFEKLTSVSGIGPKSALAILAGEDTNGVFNAIEAGDITYLTKFPGVGKKTAQQILLDLQGKIQTADKNTSSLSSTGLDLSANMELNDGLEALISLGYSTKDVKKITDKLKASDAKTADEYVREGLKLLMN